MSLSVLLARYAYTAVFAGTFIEGETVLVLAGLLAQQHRLAFWGVIAAAFAGAYTGHVVWFWVGRRHARAMLMRAPRMQAALDRMSHLIARYGTVAIFIGQYLYGLRMAGAIAFGASSMRTARFLLVQIVNCAVWALVIGGAGYLFGHATERVLGTAARIEKYALIAVVVLFIAMAVIHRLVRRPR